MRPARALIDLQALRHNYQLAREVTGAKALAVVKADAYGHGAVRVAQALETEADGFAVACIEEALELRAAGIRAPVLLLEGFFEASELPLINEHDLWCVVHSLWQLDAIEQARLSKPLTIWLKLDSGMHRVGLHPKDYHEAYQRLLASGKVAKIVLMSHFARADELDCVRSDEQVAVFEAARHGLAAEVSLRNSPSVMGWPNVTSDWVRPGIILYGVSPLETGDASDFGLQPVMTLTSSLIAVREHAAGEPVGYGSTWTSDRDTRLGVVAMGYGDGYPRSAPNGTPVRVNGRIVPIAGRVSMDMITVDLGPDATDRVGDEVIFWGKDLPAERVAAATGISAYELITQLSERVSRNYIGD